MAAVVEVDLHCPPLEEVAEVFRSGVQSNFANVDVSVVDCPDLTQPPFNLVSQGICGHTRLLDIGGVPYLVPRPKLDKIYNMKEIGKAVGLPKGTFIGSGAGSSRLTGMNCELIANVSLDTGEIGSYFAKVTPPEDTARLIHYESMEFGLLCNLLGSDGLPGKVIRVEASNRISDANFVSCIRLALAAKFGSSPVGIGGVFLIKRGKAKFHIMPDFSPAPLESDADVSQWLKFFHFDAPLTCLSTFVSHDPGLGLRLEHTHCFSDHGCGGHYHYDATPEDIVYEGYFVVSEKLFRIDQPM